MRLSFFVTMQPAEGPLPSAPFGPAARNLFVENITKTGASLTRQLFAFSRTSAIEPRILECP